MRVFTGPGGIFDAGGESALAGWLTLRAARWRGVWIVARVLARSGKQERAPKVAQRRRCVDRRTARRTKIDHSSKRGTDANETNAHFLCIKGKTMKQPNDVFNEFQAEA